MKQRNGFVSNSSTSSFFVKYFEKPKGKKKIYHLSPPEIRKLKKRGFKPTQCPKVSLYDRWPDENDEDLKHCNIFDTKLATWVSCNQDDEIEFLLKNNISFKACCHYGDYHVFYEKNDKYFYEVINVGDEAENWLKFFQKKPSQIKKEWENTWFKKVSVKKFLSRQEKWNKEYLEDLKKEFKEEKNEAKIGIRK